MVRSFGTGCEYRDRIDVRDIHRHAGAALTEVLNVLPILAKRLRLTGYLFGLLMAMVAGKVAGSLFDWFVYSK